LNKFKTNHLAADAPRSPLALTPNSDFILVKKRKNVQKVTIATQTDQSYIQKIRAQGNSRY
jgi:hypothetical protein